MLSCLRAASPSSSFEPHCACEQPPPPLQGRPAPARLLRLPASYAWVRNGPGTLPRLVPLSPTRCLAPPICSKPSEKPALFAAKSEPPHPHSPALDQRASQL